MTTLFYKIPPNLPLTKGGMVRQAHHDICHPELVEEWKRGARGDFLINVNSIMRPLIFHFRQATAFSLQQLPLLRPDCCPKVILPVAKQFIHL
jgi:hypothetical protein